MRFGRAAWPIALAALILTVALGLAVLQQVGGRFAREIVVRELARRAGLEVEIGAIDLWLIPPRVALADVTLTRGAERLLDARAVEMTLSVWRSLSAGAWIADVSLTQPTIGLGDRSRLWQEIAASLRSPGEAAAKPAFLPGTLMIRGGRLDLDLARAGAHAEIRELFVEASLRDLAGRRVAFDIAGRIGIDRAGHHVELTRVAARGEAASTGVRLDSAVVDGQSGSFRASGALAGQRLHGQLDWSAALDPLFALIPEAGVVRGGGRIQARLSGTTATPAIAADLDARVVRIGSVEFSGSGHLASDGNEWTLEQVRADMFGGKVEGSARGKLSLRAPFDAQAKFVGWDPAVFIELFNARTPLRGKWSGEAEIGGSLFGSNDYRGRGRFTLEEGDAKVAGYASFDVTKTSALVEGGAEHGSDDRIHARYQVIDHSEISGNVEAQARELAVFGTFVGLPLGGSGHARAEFLGTVERPLFRGDGDFAELAVGGIRLGAVRGPFEISREGFRSSELDVDRGAVRVSGLAALTASQQNDWSASTHGASLARAALALRIRWPGVPALQGRVDGEARVTGPWSRLTISSGAEIADASVAGEALGNGHAALELNGGRWTGRGTFRRPDGGQANFSIGIDPDGKLSADLSADRWRLEGVGAVHSWNPNVAGVVGLQGSLAGSVSRPRGDVVLELADLQTSGRPLGRGTVHLRAEEGDRVAIDATLSDNLHVSGEISLLAPYGFHGRADWHDFDAGSLASVPASVAIVTSGEADLRGDAGQPLAQGSARFAVLRLERGAERLENRAPVVVRIASGSIDVPDAELVGTDQHVVVGGRWTTEAADAHASVRSDLALLESFSSTVASARGRIEADLRASRRGEEAWNYRGRVKVMNGALDLAFLLGVTDLAAELDIEERKLELHELTGNLGGGKFLAAGTLGLDTGWDVGWAIHEASLGVPSWLDYRASGNGRVAGQPSAPALTGEIEIAQAIYDRRIEWAEFLPWFRKQAAPGREARTLPLAVDLHIVADGGVFIDNNLAKSEMRCDLRLRGGREQAITLDGPVEVLSGEFVFRRRRFTITSGSIQFHQDRPTNPDLQFSGETRVDTRDEEYEIQVNVSGTADDPRIQFTADDPSLTENDVLALVTFGRTVAQLQSQGAGIELSDVLALTAGPRAGNVEKRIHTLLPLDRIEIEPSYSRLTGVSEPRLSIAKDLAERLSAVVATGLGAERHQEVGLEYQVTRRFSLQGIWESQTKSEAGTFGGNFKFRLPFRALPRFSLLPRSSSSRLEEP